MSSRQQLEKFVLKNLAHGGEKGPSYHMVEEEFIPEIHTCHYFTNMLFCSYDNDNDFDVVDGMDVPLEGLIFYPEENGGGISKQMYGLPHLMSTTKNTRLPYSSHFMPNHTI
ncbi:hypothetical protein O6H91_17G038900 [Diphasiastrum complanatum]|uniref:Uncharacterized protein n=1 Tax=Diphasiastrum complanatum TaxID=34168 RepID=A0ACC2B5U7_DIPCM|nr:hypothetical protein O6H91_17G038900 [Diphasiastrum complanatum]